MQVRSLNHVQQNTLNFIDYIQSKAICTHNFNINFTVVDCSGDLTEEDQCKACSDKFWESGECKGI